MSKQQLEESQKLEQMTVLEQGKNNRGKNKKGLIQLTHCSERKIFLPESGECNRVSDHNNK